MGVAGLAAVVDETAHRVVADQLQEGTLVEGEGNQWRCGI
jgi:hypothetical protein